MGQQMDVRKMPIQKRRRKITEKPSGNDTQRKAKRKHTMPAMWKNLQTRGELKTTSNATGMQRKPNGKQRKGEEEWGEICFRNPLWRLRKKTKKSEYLEKLARKRIFTGTMGSKKIKQKEKKKIKQEKETTYNTTTRKEEEN